MRFQNKWDSRGREVSVIDKKTRKYLTNLQDISDRNVIIKLILEGAQHLFPFSRIQIFAFSPLNFIMEHLITKENDRILQYHQREDIRNLPNVLEAAIKKQTVFVMNAEESNVPIKYIEQFDYSTFWIVPLSYANAVNGFVVLDQFNSSQPNNEQMLQSIESYFLLSSQLLCSPLFAKPFISLSKREIDVLQQSAHGYSYKEISAILEISEFTVREYMISAVKKLNVINRTQAVAEALRQNLIQ
jgi:DNA-binding CsgD family transcriptional regulator